MKTVTFYQFLINSRILCYDHHDMKQFQPLKKLFLKNLKYIVFGFLCLITVDIFQLIVPLIIKKAVDALTRGLHTSDIFVRYALIITVIAAATAVCRFSWRYCIIGSSRRIEMELRNRIFAHIIRLPMSELLQRKTGDLMARTTNDLEAVRMFTGIGLVAFFDTIFLGLTAVGFMIYINPLLTAFTLAPMLFIIIATWQLSSQLHHRFKTVQATFAKMTEFIRETISGIAIIKAYTREELNTRDFSLISSDYIRKNISLVKVLGLFFPLIMFFSNLSICVLVFFGGRMTLFNAITPGDFVAFASYIWILTWPMMALGWVVNLFQRASASIIRINEILNIPTEPVTRNSVAAGPLTGSIEIKNLKFSYISSRPPILKNINLSIHSGETIGITGKTGSGKTTLLNLLQRFFTPPRGTIFIDGRDITDMNLQDLRSGISFVPQDSFLFSDTIRQNISFGSINAADDEIRQTARWSGIYEEIIDFSDGFNTRTGEKGITLSGGQKQRLCIARALIKSAPILILDDCLSSLDMSTTRKIVNTFQSATLNCTTIIVSNRIASIQHADRIIVFSEGEITDQGKHDELIRRKGLYRDLYQMQQIENEL